MEASLCFAATDGRFAKRLADYLAAHTGLTCELAETATHAGFLDLVEQCLARDLIIVILSRDTVPATWPRPLWELVLVEGAKESGTRIAYVLLTECAYPPVLRRRDFFDCSQDTPAGFRAVRRWAIRSLQPQRLAPVIAIDVEPDDSLLWLVDAPGVAQTSSGAADVWLVKQHWQSFEGIYRVNCAHRTRAGILGELAEEMRLQLRGTVEQIWLRLCERAAAHRGLYVFEHLPGNLSGIAELGGKSSVIRAAGALPKEISFSAMHGLFSSSILDERACLRALNAFITGHHSRDYWPEIYSIGTRALRILRDRSRRAEAHELLTWLADGAREHRDARALETIRWEEKWILDEWDLPASERAELIHVPSFRCRSVSTARILCW